MNKTHSILAGLLTIIIWAVLLWLHGKRERNRWLVVDSLTDALRRSNDRVDKEAQKVKQLEAALLDQDKVIKAQHNELESAKKKIYAEINELVTKVKAAAEVEINAKIVEAKAKQAAEKADEKVPSFLESLIKEMELRNFEPVMAGKITIHSETKKEI
jgi:hypothetical protein